MSTTLTSLRAEIIDAFQLAMPNEPNLHDEDPREQHGFEKDILSGRSVRTTFIEDFNPSASSLPDSSDYSAFATIVMLRSVSKGAKKKMQDDAQLVIRRLRDIDCNRSAVGVGIDTVTVAGRYLCYQLTISAEFYALQTLA